MKPVRDFSDWMRFDAPALKGDKSHVTYFPSESHKIDAAVLPKSGMTFLIQTVQYREKYGSGTEVFLSAVKNFTAMALASTRSSTTGRQSTLAPTGYSS